MAKHLSENYGDRAWTVCTFAQPTGDTWPLHGHRLSAQYPCTTASLYYICTPPLTFHLADIEAEVHYAVHHEYAQTAIDVIARRTRLSFLNVQAALNALPRVVEIMGGELGWSLSRKREEMQKATVFLASMGLAPGAVVPQIKPNGLREKVESAFWWGLSGAGLFGTGNDVVQRLGYSRAQFEAGEIDSLRTSFRSRAEVVSPAKNVQGTEGANGILEYRLTMAEAQALLKELPGYEGVRGKDFEYVLEEAGLGRKQDMDFDEFVEVCRSLVPVSFVW